LSLAGETTFSIVTFSITTFSITKFSIIKLSIKALYVRLSITMLGHYAVPCFIVY